MKARPILFSTPMVKALLEGRKTQTRRTAKTNAAGRVELHGKQWHPEDKNAVAACPYGKPGDLLWVRETWGIAGDMPHDPGYVEYRANCKDYFNDVGDRVAKWRPSIHMPRTASRLTLRITDVRVERLQEISETDAIAEGIERVGGTASCNPWRNYRIGEKDEMSLHCSAPSRSYMTLWESINGPGSWAANPWVWVVSFDVIKANVDAVLKEDA